MKNILVLVICAVALLTTGCKSSFSPREYGNATGISLYLGYSRIADRNSDEFKKAIEDVWLTIQAIESYDDLEESADEITKIFDKCIANAPLKPEEKQLCLILKRRITDKVAQVLSNTLERDKNATEFLLGVREGIAEMVVLQQ